MNERGGGGGAGGQRQRSGGEAHHKKKSFGAIGKKKSFAAIDRNQILANGTMLRRANRALQKQGRNGGGSSNSESPWHCPAHFAIAAAAPVQGPLQIAAERENLLDGYQLGLVACDSFQTSLITDEAVTEKVTADLRLPERFPRHSLGCAAGSKLVEPS